MAHKIYDNFYLSNEVEDQFNSHLDLQQFCTIDSSLTGNPGMTRKINVYSASSGTEKLKQGEGNTKSIDVTLKDREYKITLAQNRFKYFDEQAMTDPMLVPAGMRHVAVDLFNTMNTDIYNEFKKAPIVVPAKNFKFDSFVDVLAAINTESVNTVSDKTNTTDESVALFAFINNADSAELRKQLKDDLKYVEAFVRTGYIGTVGGINIYTKKDATTGTITVATSEAVTLFNKKGTEIEQARDGNTRENIVYARKYYLAALTDETKAAKILKGEAALTTDTTVQSGKTYYKKLDIGYIVGKPNTNPKTEGFYEIA